MCICTAHNTLLLTHFSSVIHSVRLDLLYLLITFLFSCLSFSTRIVNTINIFVDGLCVYFWFVLLQVGRLLTSYLFIFFTGSVFFNFKLHSPFQVAMIKQRSSPFLSNNYHSSTKGCSTYVVNLVIRIYFHWVSINMIFILHNFLILYTNWSLLPILTVCSITVIYWPFTSIVDSFKYYNVIWMRFEFKKINRDKQVYGTAPHND